MNTQKPLVAFSFAFLSLRSARSRPSMRPSEDRVKKEAVREKHLDLRGLAMMHAAMFGI
jgi:hypothetical protein